MYSLTGYRALCLYSGHPSHPDIVQGPLKVSTIEDYDSDVHSGSTYVPESVPKDFGFMEIDYGFQLMELEGGENVFTFLASHGQHGRSECILLLTQVDGGNRVLGKASVPFRDGHDSDLAWACKLINNEMANWYKSKAAALDEQAQHGAVRTKAVTYLLPPNVDNYAKLVALGAPEFVVDNAGRINSCTATLIRSAGFCSVVMSAGEIVASMLFTDKLVTVTLLMAGSPSTHRVFESEPTDDKDSSFDYAASQELKNEGLSYLVSLLPPTLVATSEFAAFFKHVI